jgi:hypothetical protein
LLSGSLIFGAIMYAGGVNRNDLYVGIATRQGILNSINTTLIAAGWTSGLANAVVNLNYTGQPADGNTVTLAGVVYTMRVAVGAPANEVLIGGSAAATYQNLKDAVNAGPGSGVTYSAATVQNPTLQATALTATQLRIEARTGGFGGSGTAVSETLANATLSAAATVGGGYRWISARTPQGLASVCFGVDGGETANPPILAFCRLVFSNVETVQGSGAPGGAAFQSHPFLDNTVSANDPQFGFRLGIGTGGANWRVIANRYQFFVGGDGVGNGISASWAAGGVPFLAPFIAPKIISAASNTTPIRITTTVPHLYTTGDTIASRGVQGNTAANATVTITAINATQYDLDGTVGNGAYTGGGFCGKIDLEVAEAIWATGENPTKFIVGQLSGNSFSWQLLNGASELNGTGAGAVNLIVGAPGHTDNAANELLFYNQAAFTSEALIGWGTSAGAAFRALGQLWDAVIVNKSLTMGITGAFDSHNWRNLTDANSGSAVLAEGSVLHVIP